MLRYCGRISICFSCACHALGAILEVCGRSLIFFVVFLRLPMPLRCWGVVGERMNIFLLCFSCSQCHLVLWETFNMFFCCIFMLPTPWKSRGIVGGPLCVSLIVLILLRPLKFWDIVRKHYYYYFFFHTPKTTKILRHCGRTSICFSCVSHPPTVIAIMRYCEKTLLCIFLCFLCSEHHWNPEIL